MLSLSHRKVVQYDYNSVEIRRKISYFCISYGNMEKEKKDEKVVWYCNSDGDAL